MPFWAIFCLPPPPPPNNPENQHFEKMMRASGEVITLTCVPKITIIWCMLPERSTTDNFFRHFEPFFCPFTPLLTPKIKIWKKKVEEHGDIILLHMCTINTDCMIYGSWDIRHDGHFLPFDHLKNLKNVNLAKMKKRTTWRYYCFTNVYDKWKSYDVWFLRYGAQNIFLKFFLVMDHFLPFHQPKNTEKQNFEIKNQNQNINFEKMKKNPPADIIILNMYIINKNHDVWFLRYFFSFGTTFCPFTPLTTQKFKILRKRKKCLEISSFYTSVPKPWSYTILFLRHGTWQM